MQAASISDVDVTLLDMVARASISDAAVHGVLVVEATAGRVDLQQLVAHLGRGGVGLDIAGGD